MHDAVLMPGERSSTAPPRPCRRRLARQISLFRGLKAGPDPFKRSVLGAAGQGGRSRQQCPAERGEGRLRPSRPSVSSRRERAEPCLTSAACRLVAVASKWRAPVASCAIVQVFVLDASIVTGERRPLLVPRGVRSANAVPWTLVTTPLIVAFDATPGGPDASALVASKPATVVPLPAVTRATSPRAQRAGPRRPLEGHRARGACRSGDLASSSQTAPMRFDQAFPREVLTFGPELADRAPMMVAPAG